MRTSPPRLWHPGSAGRGRHGRGSNRRRSTGGGPGSGCSRSGSWSRSHPSSSESARSPPRRSMPTTARSRTIRTPVPGQRSAHASWGLPRARPVIRRRRSPRTPASMRTCRARRATVRLRATPCTDAVARSVTLPEPPSSICARCHATTTGRPASFPQVDLATHYVGGPCLRCHDPHSVVAHRPPTVTHPLADLPECTTCHAPDGLKKIPTGHQVVGDTVCLACHGIDANVEPRRP